MLLTSLVFVPLIGLFVTSAALAYNINIKKVQLLKTLALAITILDLIISLIIFILFDYSSKQFQFVQEHYEIGHYDFYLGVDAISIYFVLLTTIIMPISIISNWKSLKDNTRTFLIIILLLETSLLIVFLVLDILMFYIFFESILAPLFILIGLFGSNEKVRASFYFFLYTLLGSLFMLLSIISMLSSTGCTDFDVLYKTNYVFITQVFLFIGIFIAFAVKTPTIYLNSWLLKAHVESPLSGSIILAGIVLKLSLYGIFRLILPILPKAFLYFTYVIFLIGVVTIIYASLSTLRTIDVKELIAYSSVSHAAVYLIGVFSNVIQGLQGGITLGLAHGFVSSGLFISAGGVLYDRSSTRLITYYRGIAQVMPLFCILFFILSLGNCGVPLTLNFLGEFLSLYGVFERLPLAGVLASSSIVFSAAYTIFMYNRIAFGGAYFVHYWDNYIPDLNKREYYILLSLVLFTIILGIYPAIILDGLHYSTYCVLFTIDSINPIEGSIEHGNYETQLFNYYFFEDEMEEYIYDMPYYLIISSLTFVSMVYFIKSIKNSPFVMCPVMPWFGIVWSSKKPLRMVCYDQINTEKIAISIIEEDLKPVLFETIELREPLDHLFKEELLLFQDNFNIEMQFLLENTAMYNPQYILGYLNHIKENKLIAINYLVEIYNKKLISPREYEHNYQSIDEVLSKPSPVNTQLFGNYPKKYPNSISEYLSGGESSIIKRAISFRKNKLTTIQESPGEVENDSTEPWGLFFQDNVTPQMERLEELHNNIMFYLTVILFALSWIIISIILKYSKAKIYNIYNEFSSNSILKIGTVLMLIALLTFNLLNSMDDIDYLFLVFNNDSYKWYLNCQYLT